MDGGELPPVVLLNRAVAWKVWMGPYVSLVHTVLTQEGHLQQGLEQGMIKLVLPRIRSGSRPTGIQGSLRQCRDNVGLCH